ncbi:HD family phosphohydrolase [Geopsychrobacter electrodiphilus]|uniref:HD family phosphohydrolase n=1 Tax=Geopsychrobacter electrodiphilus TaxID=225196 RepID=UPI0003682518|nr:HDIG domain-containing metalloprotein [Geopsychrobacter electrodiphilus]
MAKKVQSGPLDKRPDKKVEKKSEKKGDRKSFASAEQARLWYRDKNQVAKVLLIVIALLLTLVIIPKGGFIPEYHVPGEIASRDIKSPRDLLIEDEPLTLTKREEARQAIHPLYDFDADAGHNSIARLNRGLRELTRAAAQPETAKAADATVTADGDEDKLRAAVETAFGVALTDEDYKVLKTLPADLDVAALTLSLQQEVFDRPLVANLKLFLADQAKGVVVRDLSSQTEKVYTDLPRVMGLTEALAGSDPLLKQTPGIKRAQRKVLLGVFQQLLRPSLTYNQQETELRRQRAFDDIAPVLFQVKKGEMIVREGERVTAVQIAKLHALSELGRDNRTLQIGFGLLLCILIFYATAHCFVRSSIRKYNPDVRALLFLACTTLVFFLVVKTCMAIATGLASTVGFIDANSFYYAIPFAMGAMVVRIILNSETALIFSVCISWLVGVLFGNSLFIALYVLASSLMGAHGVRHCKERSNLYRAGVWVALVNAGMLLGIHLLAGKPLDLQLLYKLGLGLFGGLLSAVVVNGIIPLAESIFKYTTDIKFLELANMNSPVLRELMVQAPGTYHHSMIVGSLVESAAEEIGANPLLARVAAYYHDIGKIKKPLYFFENTGGQRNKHDKLAPSMSALILTAHVKEGVELARERKLGAPIIDIIQQHHGTALIKFFYEKAKLQVKPGMEQIDERAYRYHGPKPQTREAALIMLADAVEAASRTLTDPTSARIQGMVKKLINNIFIDGQLEECDLTLKDLHLIARSFNQVLGGIFHNRIDYPEPVHIVREKKMEAEPTSENPDREPPTEPEDPDAAAAKDSHKDLKRLGIP